MGPALFGPDLGENEFQVCTRLDTPCVIFVHLRILSVLACQVTAQLTETEPLNGCGAFPNEDLIKGKIVLVTRGGCLFLVKVSMYM